MNENKKDEAAPPRLSSGARHLVFTLEQLIEASPPSVADHYRVVLMVVRAAGVQELKLQGENVDSLEAELRSSGERAWSDLYHSSTDSETADQPAEASSGSRTRRITGTEGTLVESEDGWELRVPLGRLTMDSKGGERRE